MQLRCQACGTALHGRDVDFDTLRATCRKCGWQLGGEPQGAYRARQPVTVPSPASQQRGKDMALPPPPLPDLPDHMSVISEDPRLRIEIRPRFAFLYVPAVAMHMLGLGLIARDMMLGVGGMVLATPLALAGIWWLGVHLVNTRRVVVERGLLEVTSSPFPERKKRVRVSDLTQLWVDEHRSLFRDRRRPEYRLRALVGDRHVTLIGNFEAPLGLLYLERRIEDRLGISDVPHAEEIDPTRF